jgi:hypothetical protein
MRRGPGPWVLKKLLERVIFLNTGDMPNPVRNRKINAAITKLKNSRKMASIKKSFRIRKGY